MVIQFTWLFIYLNPATMLLEALVQFQSSRGLVLVNRPLLWRAGWSNLLVHGECACKDHMQGGL